MVNIRYSIFETNSSSTHAMVVSHEAPTFYPRHVHFRLDEFGWEFNILKTIDDKAAYLYTSICCMLNDKELIKAARDYITEALAQVGVSCHFDTPKYENYDYYDWLENGNIDHCGEDEHYEWVNCMLANPDALCRFLFTPTSYVVTGNDNCSDEEYEWKCEHANPPYEHTTYYKGN